MFVSVAARICGGGLSLPCQARTVCAEDQHAVDPVGVMDLAVLLTDFVRHEREMQRR
jgi:hypothetical protein